MCMIDGADGYCSVWSESHHKARKVHRCQECSREIQPGERYFRIFTVFEGDADHNKICSHCEVACEWLRANCGGFMLHAVREDIHEHVQEYRRSDLARLDFSMDRGWKYRRGPKAGQLRPIPACPAPIKLGDAR